MSHEYTEMVHVDHTVHVHSRMEVEATDQGDINPGRGSVVVNLESVNYATSLFFDGSSFGEAYDNAMQYADDIKNALIEMKLKREAVSENKV